MNFISLTIFSPLEPFKMIPDLFISNSFFSFDNAFLFLVFYFVTMFAIVRGVALGSSANLDLQAADKKGFLVIPSRYQTVFEKICQMVSSLLSDNVKHSDGMKFFPLLFFVALFLASINFFGLLPFSFGLTSQLIVTATLALVIYIGIIWTGVREHGLISFLRIFLPPGTSVVLAIILVPIEFISFLFKPISLAVRLFANMMAGHTLLHVITLFGVKMMHSASVVVFFGQIVPFFVVLIVFVLELAVAFIQAYVFTILVCIYINEALALH